MIFHEKNRQGSWKAHFAWFPTKINRVWVWLEWYDVSDPWLDGYDDICWTRRFPSRIRK